MREKFPNLPIIDPPAYPGWKDFAILLSWHLNSWGTYSGGDYKQNYGPWHLPEFAALIVGDGLSDGAPMKNLSNWMKSGEAPPQDKARAIRMLEVLFGPEPRSEGFEVWRNDLIAAWEHWYEKPLFDGAGNGQHSKSERFNRRRQHKHLDSPNLIAAPSLAPFSHHQLHKLKTEPKSLIQLLQTDVRATTLVGRVHELTMIHEWLAIPQNIAIKCILGGAGAGKTRLAIEACERAEAKGWFATFLSSMALQPPHDVQALADWTPPQPTLFVVDYAATSASAIKRWLNALARLQNRSGHKLRILFLERHADRESGWWADILRPDSLSHASAADLIGVEAPYSLPLLDAADERRALLSDTMAKAALLLDPSRLPPELPLQGVDMWFDQRLDDSNFNAEPLFLIMAAIRAVECGAPTALAMNRLELARWFAVVEEERLKKFAAAQGFVDGGNLLLHIAACVTLQNGCEQKKLPSLVSYERQALGVVTAIGDEKIAEILSNYLKISIRVDPVKPDVIGEYFCMSIIIGGRFRSENFQRDIVDRCWQRDSVGTIETLVRCACDLTEGNSVHPSILYLRGIVEQIDDHETLREISEKIPPQSLCASELSHDILLKIVNLLRTENNLDSRDIRFDLAMALHNLGNRLRELGRLEEALDRADEGLAILRELASIQPENFNAILAISLNSIAAHLGNLGRTEDSLAAVQEALEIRRELADTWPSRFMPDFAMTLNSLAIQLGSLGRSEEALSAANDAVELYRSLEAGQPGAFASDLAMALNTFANRLGALGGHEQALVAAREALTLRRRIAATKPDAFLPDLAMALNNFATRLGDLGHCVGALPLANEALGLYRQLAAIRPNTYLFDLAGALDNYGSRLGDLERHEEALAATQEALALYRRLAVARPGAITHHLAMALNNFTIRLSVLGRFKEALEAAEETLSVRFQLQSEQPGAYNSDVARAFMLVAGMLELNDRIGDSVSYNHGAITALKFNFFKSPSAFSTLMNQMVEQYIRRCAIGSFQLDYELVEIINIVLNQPQRFNIERI